MIHLSTYLHRLHLVSLLENPAAEVWVGEEDWEQLMGDEEGDEVGGVGVRE